MVSGGSSVPVDKSSSHQCSVGHGGEHTHCHSPVFALYLSAASVCDEWQAFTKISKSITNNILPKWTLSRLEHWVNKIVSWVWTVLILSPTVGWLGNAAPRRNARPRLEDCLMGLAPQDLEPAASSVSPGVGETSATTPPTYRTLDILQLTISPPLVSISSTNSTQTSVSSVWTLWSSAWTWPSPAPTGTAARTSWPSPPLPRWLLPPSVLIINNN